MSMNLKVLLAIIFLAPTTVIFSQTITKEDKLEARVNALEDYKAEIQIAYQNSVSKLETKMKDELEDKKKEIDESTRLLKMLAFAGIPSTILALLGVYFGAIKKAKKIVIEKIETIVEDKREAIIKLIETQEFDTQLRNTKKILVLSTQENSQDIIKILISKFKFKNVNYRVVNSFTDFNEHDLIIFNNGEGDFSQELINEYLRNANDENASFVAFTNKNLDRDHRMNFSNNPYTLYHSILSTLKYTVILKS